MFIWARISLQHPSHALKRDVPTRQSLNDDTTIVRGLSLSLGLGDHCLDYGHDRVRFDYALLGGDEAKEEAEEEEE